MMPCRHIHDQLGPYVDGELDPHTRAVVEAHLRQCSTCRAELRALHDLANGIAEPPNAVVPPDLWSTIETRLQPAQPMAQRRTAHLLSLRRPLLPVAALIAMGVGLTLLGLAKFDSPAEASMVDFSVLLDALPLDSRGAFRRFLEQYEARLTTVSEARRSASSLNFDIPEQLPGGFILQEVFTLRFGAYPGVAARYDRDGEFLAAIFHRPVGREDFGSHRDYPCIVGKHRGHKVEVGEWKLVHLTDQTTCHCVLSRLDEDRELPAIMAAVAPRSVSSSSDHEHP